MSKTFLPLIAILMITLVEIVAMQCGLDGTVLSMSVASIAGIAGYSIKSKLTPKI
jgi:hypothetical protein